MQKTKLSPRRLSRSLAVQGLYFYQTNPRTVGEIEDFLYSFNPDLYTRANYELFHSLVDVACNDFTSYLELYTAYSNRPLDEIQPVEKAILVIAAIELKNSISVPAPVIINEAIELAKLYGAEESFKFVNGLVDKLANLLRAQEMQLAATK
jgi:N utilization substance protein B